jgi:hypothetical protein
VTFLVEATTQPEALRLLTVLTLTELLALGSSLVEQMLLDHSSIFQILPQIHLAAVQLLTLRQTSAAQTTGRELLTSARGLDQTLGQVWTIYLLVARALPATWLWMYFAVAQPPDVRLREHFLQLLSIGGQ